ncbi:MAG TPA: SGNH/GDSL hydrolase family protein [Ktedonobacteraceae bacterium]|nr:SGNH/GDSL hydrolase family protein [Ktedonobacteraceae bacterium]
MRSFLSRHRILSTIIVFLALAIAMPLFSSAKPTLAHVNTPRSIPGWVGTWAASPQAAPPASINIFPGDLATAGFNNQTVRNIIFTSRGGSALRIRLSNTFGTQPLTISQATVGVELNGAILVANMTRTVTFSGHTSVTIPVGQELVSDPIPFTVLPLENLAVSLFLPQATGPATNHADAQQTNFVASGNHASDSAATAFTTQSGTWYYLDAVDVFSSSASTGSIVAFGDSITDGFQSQGNANGRWPNQLARRLVASFGSQAPGVLDAGISGNRVLNDSVCFGQNAIARFQRDALSQAGVHTVILLEGINDIGFSSAPNSGCTAPNTNVSAQQIIQGYMQLIAQAHAHHVRILGATLTPAFNITQSAENLNKWQTINTWIRTSHAFDGVIDFADATADPFNPLIFNPGFNSGDELHPNDAGYQAMANSINLAELI